MPRALVITGIVAAFAGLLWAATMAGAGISCEACLDLGGKPFCQTVRAATHEQAAQTVISNLCNAAGRDVTDRLACQRSPGTKLRCSDDAR